MNILTNCFVLLAFTGYCASLAGNDSMKTITFKDWSALQPNLEILEDKLHYKYVINYENGKSDSLEVAPVSQSSLPQSTFAECRLIADVKDSCFRVKGGVFDGRIREHRLINIDGKFFKNIQVLLYLDEKNIGRARVNVLRS